MIQNVMNGLGGARVEGVAVERIYIELDNSVSAFSKGTPLNFRNIL